MASPSGTPPTAAKNARNLGHEQQQKEVQQDGKAEVDKQITTIPLDVNPEPMREEQVQNAAKFLSHPKVRGSPVVYRRSFLENKGLNKEEIDEAFRRVPDPPLTAVACNVSQDEQMKLPSNNQRQALTQNLQPSATEPTAVVSSLGTLKRGEFHWSHAILAVGLLSISAAGTTLIIKNKIIPRLKSWIRKVMKDGDEELVKRENSRPSVEEAAAAAAKSAAEAAAEAAADVAKVSQEILKSKYEERRKFEEFVGLLNVQLQEMKYLTSAIRSLGVSGDSGQTEVSGRASVAKEGHLQVNVTVPKLYAKGKMDYDFSAVESSLPQTSGKSSTAPHHNAYLEHPWEFSQVPSNSNHVHKLQRQSESFYSTKQNYGTNYQLSGDDPASWWQQHNVRNAEIDDGDNLKAVSSVGRGPELPIRLAWVPPQPPRVEIPEAAEAIQQSKSTVQTESLDTDQLVTPPDMPSELQGITKHGSAGEVGLMGEALGPTQDSSEIQEE